MKTFMKMAALSLVMFSLVFFTACSGDTKTDSGKTPAEKTVKKESKEDHPLASFFGAKWGMNGNEFIKSFKFGEKMVPMGTDEADEGALKGFELLEFEMIPGHKFQRIGMVFNEKEGPKIPFTPENYEKFAFNTVMIPFNPEKYDVLLKFFKERYGEPNLKEGTTVRWDNEELKRQVVLDRNYQGGDTGFMLFFAVDVKK